MAGLATQAQWLQELGEQVLQGIGSRFTGHPLRPGRSRRPRKFLNALLARPQNASQSVPQDMGHGRWRPLALAFACPSRFTCRVTPFCPWPRCWLCIGLRPQNLSVRSRGVCFGILRLHTLHVLLHEFRHHSSFLAADGCLRERGIWLGLVLRQLPGDGWPQRDFWHEKPWQHHPHGLLQA